MPGNWGRKFRAVREQTYSCLCLGSAQSKSDRHRATEAGDRTAVGSVQLASGLREDPPLAATHSSQQEETGDLIQALRKNAVLSQSTAALIGELQRARNTVYTLHKACSQEHQCRQSLCQQVHELGDKLVASEAEGHRLCYHKNLQLCDECKQATTICGSAQSLPVNASLKAPATAEVVAPADAGESAKHDCGGSADQLQSDLEKGLLPTKLQCPTKDLDSVPDSCSRTPGAMGSSSDPQQPGQQRQSSACFKAHPAVNLAGTIGNGAHVPLTSETVQTPATAKFATTAAGSTCAAAKVLELQKVLAELQQQSSTTAKERLEQRFSSASLDMAFYQKHRARIVKDLQHSSAVLAGSLAEKRKHVAKLEQGLRDAKLADCNTAQEDLEEAHARLAEFQVSSLAETEEARQTAVQGLGVSRYTHMPGNASRQVLGADMLTPTGWTTLEQVLSSLMCWQCGTAQLTGVCINIHTAVHHVSSLQGHSATAFVVPTAILLRTGPASTLLKWIAFKRLQHPHIVSCDLTKPFADPAEDKARAAPELSQKFGCCAGKESTMDPALRTKLQITDASDSSPTTTDGTVTASHPDIPLLLVIPPAQHLQVQESALGPCCRTRGAMASSSNPQLPGQQGQSSACCKALPAVNLAGINGSAVAEAHASLASAAVQTSVTAQNEATAVSGGSGVGTHDGTAVSSVVQRLQEEVAALQEQLKVPTKELNEELHAGMSPIAAGKNGLVFSWANPFWPNVVLKKSYKAAIEQEAKMLQAVRHPNIVGVVAVLTTTLTMPDNRPAAFLALQRLGTPLVDVKRMSARQMVVGLQHIAAALAHMHGEGLVHHDVRPSNVMLTPGGNAWCLIDLGNAAAVSKDGSPNILRRSRCARGLESPELARALLTRKGCFQPGYAMDLWALGCFVLYLLNAQLPEAHLQMLSHPDWDEAVCDPSRDPAKVPMLRAHLEYLAELQSDNEYARKIKFAAEPDAAPNNDAAHDTSSICRVNKDCLKLLRDIAKSCLAIHPEGRPRAWHVQALLFDFIAERKWTNSLLDRCQ